MGKAEPSFLIGDTYWESRYQSTDAPIAKMNIYLLLVFSFLNRAPGNYNKNKENKPLKYIQIQVEYNSWIN